MAGKDPKNKVIVKQKVTIQNQCKKCGIVYYGYNGKCPYCGNIRRSRDDR